MSTCLNASSRSPASRLSASGARRSFSWSATSAGPSGLPSSSATVARAPSQKVRPATAACWISRRSKGSRASKRAASSPWIVSGKSPPSQPLLLRGGGPSPQRRGSRPSARQPARPAPAACPPFPAGERRALVMSPGPAAPRRSGSRHADRRPNQGGGPELVAREAHHQQGSPHPPRQVLDHVEHAVVGPVNIFEGQDQRFLAGRPFDYRPQRGEEHLSHAFGVVALGRLQAFRYVEAKRTPDQRGLRLRRLCLSRQNGANVGAQLGPRLTRAMQIHDAGFFADDLAERPVDDARSVGQAPARSQCGGGSVMRRCRSNSRRRRDLPTPASPTSVTMWRVRRVRPARRLPGAHAGLGHALRKATRQDQNAEWRRSRATRRLPRRHRVGLSFQRERLESLIEDRAAGGTFGALANGHGPRPGGDCSRDATFTVSPVTV